MKIDKKIHISIYTTAGNNYHVFMTKSEYEELCAIVKSNHSVNISNKWLLLETSVKNEELRLKTSEIEAMKTIL